MKDKDINWSHPSVWQAKTRYETLLGTAGSKSANIWRNHERIRVALSRIQPTLWQVRKECWKATGRRMFKWVAHWPVFRSILKEADWSVMKRDNQKHFAVLSAQLEARGVRVREIRAAKNALDAAIAAAPPKSNTKE
jgi:hypothetical protein